MEGEFGHGRAPALCRPAAGRRGDERGPPGIRHLAQNRLQNLRSLQGARARGLSDRSRRPVRYVNQLPPRIESLIVGLKRDKPHWGARKIRELLVRRLDGDLRTPAKSTIDAVLHRHGLVKPFGRSRNPREGDAAVGGRCAERALVRRFQGRVQAWRRSILLPPDRHRSRLAFSASLRGLGVDARGPRHHRFRAAFRERGLPQAIRSDNGVPFASPNALFNLSKLSVWWLRLGISIERIKPGHPQQNGRHERMHLTLEKEATRPPGMNSLQQQARFDDFVQEFNAERPREALAMKRPAEVYAPCPNSRTRCMIATSSSPHAAASACIANGSTSRPPSQANGSESKKSTKAFGSSASCITISALSTWSRKPCAPSTPVRPEVVTHVLGTFRYLYLRAGQG